MQKKAQGLSMNVIIIAALALLVLVILSVIFMSRTGMFISDSKNCEQLGGRCVALTDECPAGYVAKSMGSMKCLKSDGSVDPDKKCCVAGE